jgi:hypothetical protein
VLEEGGALEVRERGGRAAADGVFGGGGGGVAVVVVVVQFEGQVGGFGGGEGEDVGEVLAALVGPGKRE